MDPRTHRERFNDPASVQGRFEATRRAIQNARASLEYLPVDGHPGQDDDDWPEYVQEAYELLDQADGAVQQWAERERKARSNVDKPEVTQHG